MPVSFKPIGIIHTPFKNKEGMPIQSGGAQGIKGTIVLKKEFEPGLLDLDGFSHIILIYHFHKSYGFELQTIPFIDDKPHGVFSTRAPKRPNPIGISVVRLLNINNNILEIENVDINNKIFTEGSVFIYNFKFTKNGKQFSFKDLDKNWGLIPKKEFDDKIIIHERNYNDWIIYCWIYCKWIQCCFSG
jgi:tRNA (adenine37-N6)-methyltransferase